MNYMKSNKNGVKLLATLAVIVMAFAAVGICISESELDADAATDLSTEVNAVMNNMVDAENGVYNKASGTSNDAIKALIKSPGVTGSNYWVQVMDSSSVPSKVTIGNSEYGLDSKWISVGNNNWLGIEVWKVVDGKLYIGAPYLVANATQNSTDVSISINGGTPASYKVLSTATSNATNITFKKNTTDITQNVLTGTDGKYTIVEEINAKNTYFTFTTSDYQANKPVVRLDKSNGSVGLDVSTSSYTYYRYVLAWDADVTNTVGQNDLIVTGMNGKRVDLSIYYIGSTEDSNASVTYNNSKYTVTLGPASSQVAARDATPLTFTQTAGFTIPSCMDLVVNGSTVLDASAVDAGMGLQGSLELKSGAKFVGTLYNGENTITSSNGIVAGTSNLKISVGSIKINGEALTADANGTITVTGDAKVDGTTTVQNLVIAPGATLEVPESTTLTITGNAVVSGTLDIKGTGATPGVVKVGDGTNAATMDINGTVKGKVTNTSNGTVNVPAGSNASDYVSNVGTGNVGTSTGAGDSFGMNDTLESDYTVVSSAFLSQDLTIPKGITLTVKGTLSLNNHQLIVEGKLVVESKGTIVGTPSGTTNSKIVLSETGVIENKGLIGANSSVIVKDARTTGAAQVTMKNVTGVTFTLTKVVSSTNVDYVLTVSGDVSKKGTVYGLEISGAYIDGLSIKDLVNDSTNTVNVTGATVVKNGEFTIGSKAVVKLTGTAITLNNGAVMTIDGTVVPGTQTSGENTADIVYMKNGAVVNMNGVANNVTGTGDGAKTHSIKFQAKTDSYNTYDGNGARVDPEIAIANEKITSIVIDKLSGVTLEVTSKAFMVDTTPKTEQMFNIAGTPAFTKTNGTNNAAETSGSIEITGTVYVPAGEKLVLNKDMDLTASVAIVSVGTIEAVGEITSYKGAMYEVKVTPETGSAYTVYTYTTFDTALAAIDTAEDKTVILKGGYEFNKSFTVKADQIVQFEDSNETVKYTVSKDATITVEKDGTLSEGFVVASGSGETAVAAGIQGIVVVMDGATCTPDAKSYEVMSKDANDNTTYSGAAIAIENAQPGSTIYIVDDVVFKDKTTIPKDVTVDVATGASITAQKGLVVDGTIDNEGTVSISADSDLVVSGTVNNENTVTFLTPAAGSTVTGEATITGKFVGAVIGGNPAKINAAKYQDGVDTVYTSVDAAVKAVSQMDLMTQIDVTGKFSENSDVTLADGMIVNIDGEITLSSIRLVAGSVLNITNNAALTTDIIGAVGVADTTGAVSDAVVDVSKLKNAAFTLTYNESNTTYTMTMTLNSTYTGDVKVAQGSVALANNNSNLFFGQNTALSIASGATLVVNKDSLQFTDAAGDKKYFSNDGTVSVKQNMTFVNAVIGGEVIVDVEKTLTITTTNVTNPTTVLGNSVIAGTITLSEKTDKTPAKIVINGIVRIGSAPETLGAAGTVSGDIDYSSGYAIVYAGSTFDDKTDLDVVKSTKYVINGIDYATIYTESSDVSITDLNTEILALEDIDAGTDTNPTQVKWFANGAEIASGAKVGQYKEVTTTLAYSAVTVKVSAAPGLTVYIDNLKADTTEKLAIGTHTITVYLDPDYQGTPAVTLNGKTVSGSFEITTDMLGEDNIISVTGATYVAPGTGSGSSSNNDDGMSITDILLIVLVVLIVIMAVLVAIRMMRS